MIRLSAIGYYTPIEAAECLGICPRTLYNWIDKGLLPAPVLKQRGLTIWKAKDIQKVRKKMDGE